MTQRTLKILLVGLLYEAAYELALALRWISGVEVSSFFLGGMTGIVIALIVSFGIPIKLFSATFGGLFSAFIFHELAIIAHIPLKVLFLCDPFMRDVGHFTVNENLTVLWVTAGYLFCSLLAYALTLCMVHLWRRRHSTP